MTASSDNKMTINLDPDQTKKVWIFRHGETDWNRERRLQGHTNTPLNAQGRIQARELARRLKPLHIELILSSDLERALDTAREVARWTRAPMIVLPGLRETGLGKAEGLTETEICEQIGIDFWAKWISNDYKHRDFAFPGGESKFAHHRRVVSALEQIVTRLPHRKIAVSTHGGAVRRMLLEQNPTLEQPHRIPNCATFEFRFHMATRQWTYHP